MRTAFFARLTVAMLLAMSIAVMSSAAAQAQGSSQSVWLCRPGLANNPCDTDLTTTLVDGANSRIVQTPRPHGMLPVDCFYVYPTVSDERSPNADLTIEPAERQAAAEQASRFSTVCNLWAPMYRQITGNALDSGAYDEQQLENVAYTSLLSAWNDYLLHDNDGRPIVFIGHSQGASMLIDLLRRNVDHNAALRARMISALIVGGDVMTPSGSDVGGSFLHIPACRYRTQTGCVIAYSTFASEPPEDAYFGVSHQYRTSVLCTNPAALGGGAAPLDAFFYSRDATSPDPVHTTWTEYRDVFVGRCMHEDDATWLEVTRMPSTRNASPFIGASTPQWGLHVFDINLLLGNLVDDVAAQEAAYAQITRAQATRPPQSPRTRDRLPLR